MAGHNHRGHIGGVAEKGCRIDGGGSGNGSTSTMPMMCGINVFCGTFLPEIGYGGRLMMVDIIYCVRV